MPVIGIMSTTSALKFALLTGSRDKPVWETMPDTLKFPTNEDEGKVLYALAGDLQRLFHAHQADAFSILKVVGSQHNHPSELRVKVEGLLQMLGAKLNVPVKLVAPVTLKNQEKKFDIFTGSNPEACLNGGKKFKSVDLRAAVLTGWLGLP